MILSITTLIPHKKNFRNIRMLIAGKNIITSLSKNFLCLFSLIHPVFTILCYTIAKSENNVKICFFLFCSPDFFVLSFKITISFYRKLLFTKRGKPSEEKNSCASYRFFAGHMPFWFHYLSYKHP